MSFLSNQYAFSRFMSQSSNQSGGTIQSPAQIDNIINKSIINKPQRREVEEKDDSISNEELNKIFQTLKFTTKKRGGSLQRM